MCIEVPEREEKKRAGKVLEEIMAENFPEYNEKILHCPKLSKLPSAEAPYLAKKFTPVNGQGILYTFS